VLITPDISCVNDADFVHHIHTAIDIGGEMRSPGEKAFHPGITLTQAILIAGGLTRKSNEIKLAREGANKLLELRRYKLNEINSGKLPDPLIQPGDRITVAH